MYGKEEHQVVRSLQNMRDKTQTIKKFLKYFCKISFCISAAGLTLEELDENNNYPLPVVAGVEG